MDRTEIEVTLNKDRAWLLDAYSKLAVTDLTAGVTPSEHDASVMWSPLDHLVHLAGIEQAFNTMIRRHLDGDANPVGVVNNPDGSRRPMDEIMKAVHKMNEDYVAKYRGRELSAVIALSQRVRAETLGLLAELSDEQLLLKLPGAPWADGTVGGVISVNAGHGRMHWGWMKEKAGW